MRTLAVFMVANKTVGKRWWGRQRRAPGALREIGRGDFFSLSPAPGAQEIYGADKLAVDNVGTAVNFSGDNIASI